MDHPYNFMPDSYAKAIAVEVAKGCAANPHLAIGDRVRIREGYVNAGYVGFYSGKSTEREGYVLVNGMERLAAAIEPFPYTREERIERAIEDYASLPCHFGEVLRSESHAALYAILDAGV